MPHRAKHEEADAAARLREALEHRGTTQRALAGAIGMRETSVSQILLGKQQPSSDTLKLICQHLRVHPSWVVLGLEPKYLEDSSAALAPVELAPQPPAHGIDQWLGDQGPHVTDDERAWMRAIPWPAAHVRQPDIVYLNVLAAYRQARQAQRPVPAPAVMADVVARGR